MSGRLRARRTSLGSVLMLIPGGWARCPEKLAHRATPEHYELSLVCPWEGRPDQLGRHLAEAHGRRYERG